MQREFFIGLGSNLGQPEDNVEQAIAAIANIDRLQMQARSRLYHSQAVGPKQPDYVNAVVGGLTSLPPLVLLFRLQALERNLGRTSCERWGPRLIDLDILLMQDIKLYSEALEIPHPRMQARPFVMEPLHDVQSIMLNDRKTARNETDQVMA